MANHKSAEKRAKQNLKKNELNKHRKSEVATAVRKVRTAIEAKDKTLAKGLLVKAQSLLDKLAKVGVIKRNSSGRRVSRLAEQISSLK